MYNFTAYQEYQHSQRSFLWESAVDPLVVQAITGRVEEFVSANPWAGYKIIEDANTIAALAQAAVFNDLSTPQPRYSPQQRAPLLVTVHCVNDYDTGWLHIGRLYSQLALLAREHGLATAFNNCMDYAVLDKVFETQHIHSWLCIGLPRDPTRAHNWNYLTGRHLESRKKPPVPWITQT